jgi:hypothetical protein
LGQNACLRHVPISSARAVLCTARMILASIRKIICYVVY